MKVHLECLPDETLAMALGVSKKNIKHHAGNGRVCAALEKLEDKIGFIDEEPGKPQANHKFLKELIFIEEKHGVRVLKDNKRRHTVLMVCPELEGWIVNICSEKDLTKFGFPTKANQIHRIITAHLSQFSKLVKHLEAQENKAILHLKKLLNS